MKTTDMFLSAEERKSGKENLPIVLTIQKMPQGQVLSPYIISLRGSTGARKLNNVGVQKKISQKLFQEENNINNPKKINNTENNKNLFVEPKEDEVLSSIEDLFRGKNARVEFKNKATVAENTLYKIPSQQEQFQKMRSEKKGFVRSWFGNF